MTRSIYLNLTRVFEIARTQGISTHLAADQVAEERIRKIQGLGSHHWGRFLERRAGPTLRGRI
jgi:leucine dehydrogenase